ncbi:MAG: polymerase III, delta-prime subunit protein [Candidatus Peregrinibacteria bacterium GW2011_GWA2_43_8]|nr:MAG: polymerase III, delta-prime subunit protein [Candidatus Peregrinibacteria bacterium GW2011_GWA2_43_8]
MLYKWPIIGHEEQLKRLEADLKNGHLAHAYIFVGPDKVGKFLVAKTLAGILQCPNNYCRSCPTCVQVMKGVHLDTIEMRDDGESIKIERVRALIAFVFDDGE